MCWACFGAMGKVDLAFPSARMDSVEYQEVLSSRLVPFLRKFRRLDFTYQQDNAPIHVSAATREWMEARRIKTMKWPACSPDLNPVENMWGIIVRRIYANKKQYGSVQELKNAILGAWRGIDNELIMNLVNSMNNRLFELVLKHGKYIDY